MTIKAILDKKSPDIVSVAPSDCVRDVIALFAEKRIGAVPVMESGTVGGIFSERDVVYGLAREGAALLERKIAEVMTAPALTVAPNSGAMAGLSLMTRRRVRHLPVVDSGKVVGFVSIGDIVKYRIDTIESEAEAMREYIQNA